MRESSAYTYKTNHQKRSDQQGSLSISHDQKINLQKILKDIASYLPIQNPPTSFIHNNPLLHWENKPFEEALIHSTLLYHPHKKIQADLSLRSHHLWQKKFGVDTDKILQDQLIPFVNSYLDQGIASWHNPYQQEGLWNYFVHNILGTPQIVKGYKTTIQEKYPFIARQCALDILHNELEELSIPPQLVQEFLLEYLMLFKGIAGIIYLVCHFIGQ
jgi:hypothetical protein